MYIFKENEKIGLLLPPVITIREKDEITDFFDKCVENSTVNIVADASSLILLDSEGVNYLVENVKRVRKAGGDIIIRNLTGEAALLFQHTGLDRVFTLEKDQTADSSPKKLLSFDSAKLELTLSRSKVNDIIVFHFSGVFCAPYGIKQTQDEFDAIKETTQKLLFEMQGLKYLDSPAISKLLLINRSFKEERSGQLRVCHADNLIKDIFDRVGLDLVIPVFSTVDEAIHGW